VKIVGLVFELSHIVLLPHSKTWRALSLVLLFFLFAATHQAVASETRLGVGAGIFDTLEDGETLTGSLILEAKPLSGIWDLRPTIQLLAIDDSGYYLGVGILRDFSIDKDWMFGVGVSAGVAHDSEESRALDYDLQFYSRVFLTRQINAGDSLRFELGHVSNGGLDETNPGSEPLIFFWIHSF